MNPCCILYICTVHISRPRSLGGFFFSKRVLLRGGWFLEYVLDDMGDFRHKRGRKNEWAMVGRPRTIELKNSRSWNFQGVIVGKIWPVRRATCSFSKELMSSPLQRSQLEVPCSGGAGLPSARGLRRPRPFLVLCKKKRLFTASPILSPSLQSAHYCRCRVGVTVSTCMMMMMFFYAGYLVGFPPRIPDTVVMMISRLSHDGSAYPCRILPLRRRLSRFHFRVETPTPGIDSVHSCYRLSMEEILVICNTKNNSNNNNKTRMYL